jgi:hypothetical protein
MPLSDVLATVAIYAATTATILANVGREIRSPINALRTFSVPTATTSLVADPGLPSLSPPCLTDP